MTETPNPHIVDADTLTGEMHPIRRCVLALGSNLGERLNNLQGAVNALADTPEVWVTARLAGLRDRAGRRPRGLRGLPERRRARRHHAVRPHAARPRAGHRGRLRPRADRPSRNAPRTLDVDLIVVGDRRANDEDLVLPHPRAHERAFVLAPWHDVEPDAELPDQGPVAELLEKTADQAITRRDDLSLEIQ